jgi:aminoglycoside 2'-N-acetyltransferase I
MHGAGEPAAPVNHPTRPMRIEHRHTDTIPQTLFAKILALCEAAYEEPLAQEFMNVGPGLHLLAFDGDALVAHTMLVDRTLLAGDGTMLRTGYVELVATHPAHQRKGHATALLRALVPLLADYDVGALSPSDPAFYERLGWELWRGPLSVRTATGLEASDSEEQAMILRLPRTPEALDLTAPLSVEWRPGDAW